MTLIVDAGVLYAQADRAEPRHRAVVSLLNNDRGPLWTTELVVAEADYLILRRLGIAAELAFLDGLAEGTFTVERALRMVPPLQGGAFEILPGSRGRNDR